MQVLWYRRSLCLVKADLQLPVVKCVIFNLGKQAEVIKNCTVYSRVGNDRMKNQVMSLTPSLVKNSKAAWSRFLADCIGLPSFQGLQSVWNPKGSAPKTEFLSIGFTVVSQCKKTYSLTFKHLNAVRSRSTVVDL